MNVKLIDIFASYAMQALITSDDLISTTTERKKIARLAYDMAESMVAESRTRPGEAINIVSQVVPTPP